MQRRGGPAPQAHPSLRTGQHGAPSSSSFRGRLTGSNRRKGGHGGRCNPVVIAAVVVAAACLAVLSSLLFPAQVREVEREAEGATHALAQKAMDIEQEVEGWWTQHRQRPEAGGGPVNAATARMEAQSSRWVDGEKALKKKLQVLYDMQQKGENLGVPVLTRFLGDDFPAWVEPGMDGEEWKKNVDAKYAEMRQEEEDWKKEMQNLIEQRERDIGITTP